ncbi:hypothetical protein EV426DRAFT_530521 [Tirmania nivea]|nr:hypothetical protein EV426DRAFT_530521 [Tirmania nivea]
MSNQELYFALLRISAAQTLRAAGLTTTRPSVLDTFTADITARYLQLLALTTKNFAEMSNRPGSEITVTDARAAMEHLGLIQPAPIFHWEGNSYNDDDYDDDDDTRGVDALIEWFKGPVAAELRRVAGVMPGPGMASAATATATTTATVAAEAGLGGGTQAPMAPGAPVVNTGVGTLAAATVVGTGIPPPAGGEAAVETGPVTWLDGEEHLHFYKRGGG